MPGQIGDEIQSLCFRGGRYGMHPIRRAVYAIRSMKKPSIRLDYPWLLRLRQQWPPSRFEWLQRHILSIGNRLPTIDFISRTNHRDAAWPLSSQVVQNLPRAESRRPETLQWFLEDAIDIGTIGHVKKHINGIPLKNALDQPLIGNISPFDRRTLIQRGQKVLRFWLR
jgi:hypothetical protein